MDAAAGDAAIGIEPNIPRLTNDKPFLKCQQELRDVILVFTKERVVRVCHISQQHQQGITNSCCGIGMRLPFIPYLFEKLSDCCDILCHLFFYANITNCFITRKY